MARFRIPMVKIVLGVAALVVGTLHGQTPGHAKDKVRLVDSQATVFAHFGIYQAVAEGYFEAENLDVSIIVARGGSDALQAVVTGSQDVTMFPGILSVIAAYAKGAPVTVIGAGVRGVPDTYWYVKADSPIKSFKDMDGRELVYSSPGSLSDLAVKTFAKEAGVKPKFVSVGSMAASRTQLMSGQTDTGYTGMPANYDLIRNGEARMLISGADSPTLKGMTTRVTVANSAWLARNRDVATRLMRALWRGHQFNFSAGEKAFARYAEHWKVDIADVRKMYDFYVLDDVRPAPLLKLDDSVALAKDFDFIKEPLTPEQKTGLLSIVYDPAR
jgi:NitT/TauT family transport system substrate-binding protein